MYKIVFMLTVSSIILCRFRYEINKLKPMLLLLMRDLYTHQKRFALTLTSLYFKLPIPLKSRKNDLIKLKFSENITVLVSVKEL